MAQPRKRDIPVKASASVKASAELDGVHDLTAAIALLYVEAMESCLQPKIMETLRKWIVKTDGVDEAGLAWAVILISDLEVFAPSMTGTTSLDRIARRRKLDRDEDAALSVLRRARLTVLRILSVQDERFFASEDLLTGERRTVFDDTVRSVATGSMVVARLCALPDGSFATIGPVTPIDAAGLEVVMDFVKPGKGITKDDRCATALYRHVVRNGGPAVLGFNLFPDDPDWDDVDDSAAPEISPIDLVAKAWLNANEGDAPPAERIEVVRSLASPDMVLEALFRAVGLRMVAAVDPDLAAKLAQIYRRIAELMMETLDRRAAAGSGGDPSPFDTIAAMIAEEIASNDYPREAAALFETLRRSVGSTHKPKQDGDELTKVIERIRALRAKTIDQGCTESEAMAAAAKVAELLDRYGLSVSEIDIKGQTCQGFGIDSARKRSGPIDQCLPSVARFCDCRAWTETSSTGTIRSVFFGLPADVEAARYLYERVAAAFETETATFKAGPLYADMAGPNRRTATNSFQIGLARGIAFKLNSLRDERETSFKTRSGRDLVLLKASTVEDDLAKLGLSFVSKGARARRIDRDAFDAGEVAGRQFQAGETLGD